MKIDTTTRRGIRRIFDRVTTKQWAHFFNRKDENGLINTAVDGDQYEKIKAAQSSKQRRQILAKELYWIEKVGQWLVDHGLYNKKEIEKIL